MLLALQSKLALVCVVRFSAVASVVHNGFCDSACSLRHTAVDFSERNCIRVWLGAGRCLIRLSIDGLMVPMCIQRIVIFLNWPARSTLITTSVGLLTSSASCDYMVNSHPVATCMTERALTGAVNYHSLPSHSFHMRSRYRNPIFGPGVLCIMNCGIG